MSDYENAIEIRNLIVKYYLPDICFPKVQWWNMDVFNA